MKIRHADNVVFRELATADEGVLLRLDNGQYHGLNRFGRLIWQMVGDGTTLDALIAELKAQLDSAPERLDSEVEEFVTALAARGLLATDAQE